MSELQGRICLITGGTNGIGKSAALALARMGGRVVIVGRDPVKTAQTVAELRSASNNPNVESLQADLSSLTQVRQLALDFRQRYDQLHVLINNAGALIPKRQITVDGYEMTFALNHLAYFLLTNLLLDTLKASAPARIINVSSDLHRAVRLNLDDLQNDSQTYAPMRIYGQSKLANVLFTTELAKRLAGSGVTANALHPGMVNTGFATTDTRWWMRLYLAMTKRFGRSPEKGAETIVYLASSPQVNQSNGQYFIDCKAVKPSAQGTDPNLARRLWEISERMVQPFLDPIVPSQTNVVS
jgi:NAD(P)-dependent dehydrogenase (short-subunit alcohol dehydrogenase family)